MQTLSPLVLISWTSIRQRWGYLTNYCCLFIMTTSARAHVGTMQAPEHMQLAGPYGRGKSPAGGEQVSVR